MDRYTMNTYMYEGNRFIDGDKDPEGDWVKYEDVKETLALLKETTKKLEEIADLRGVVLCKRILDYLGECGEYKTGCKYDYYGL